MFARYVPVDSSTPEIGADARSGEIAMDDMRWPPTPVAGDCTDGRNEIADFEKVLGVDDSSACPAFQVAPVPSVTTTPGATVSASPHPLGHNRYCFAQGAVVIVVETTERLFPQCKHVVSVAVYPKKVGS